MRGRRVVRSKKATLSIPEEGRPHCNRRGDRTRNLLGGGLLADSFLVLAVRAGNRGSLSVGGGVVVVRM